MNADKMPTGSETGVAYRAGRDAGTNGPDTTNTNFQFFATWPLMRAWQRGYDETRAASETVEGDDG